jgi:hypothetical protein
VVTDPDTAIRPRPAAGIRVAAVPEAVRVAAAVPEAVRAAAVREAVQADAPVAAAETAAAILVDLGLSPSRPA